MTHLNPPPGFRLKPPTCLRALDCGFDSRVASIGRAYRFLCLVGHWSGVTAKTGGGPQGRLEEETAPDSCVVTGLRKNARIFRKVAHLKTTAIISAGRRFER